MSVFPDLSGAQCTQGAPRSGAIYGYRSTNGSVAQVANVLTLWPVFIEKPVPIDRLVFWNASAVVGVAKMVMFAANSVGAAGRLLAESNQDASTNVGNAAVLCSLAANFTPPAGLNWLGIVFNALANVWVASGPGSAAVDWLMQFGDSSAHPAAGNPRIFQTAGLTYVTGPSYFMPAAATAMTYTDAVGATPILGWRAA